MVYSTIRSFSPYRKDPNSSELIRVLLVCTLLTFTGNAQANSADSVLQKMSGPQQVQLHSFQPVLLHSSVNKGTTEVIVARLVNAPPLRIANLFNDYESSPRIFSSLSESRVVSSTESSSTVDYTLRLPLPVKITYRMQHIVANNGPDIPSTKWQLISSPVLKSAEGGICFYPYKSGTLIHYRNKITPARLLQGVMKGQAHKEALKAVEELARAAEL
jgi:hypothetical protein